MQKEEKQKRRFDLQERLIDFAVRIMTVVEALPKSRAGNHIAAQLLQCDTSPAPNYGEAQGAESRNDFIHKMRIALKELRETYVWLRITQHKPLVSRPDRLEALTSECDQLIAIFVTSVATAESKKDK